MKSWTEIISFVYPHEAHLAKTLLEASDINVIVKDEFTVQMHNFLSNAIGGVKLLVEDDQAAEAIMILEDAGYIKKSLTEKKEIIKTFPAENKHICPYCGAKNITKKSIPGPVFALSILLLGFPFPFLKRSYYCYDCQKGWRIK